MTTSWNPNGYKSDENTTQWATVVHEVTWSDQSSSHPGLWHYFAKSVKAPRIAAGTYYFQGPSALPTTPYQGSYTP